MRKLLTTSFAAIAAVFIVSSLVSCGPKEEPGPSGGGSSTIAVSRVTLDQSNVTLEIGGTVSLTATVTPSNATDNTVKWSTSNLTVATVNNGTVTAVGEGSATIPVTVGGKTATCNVTVNKKVVKVVSIVLDHTEVVLDVGEEVTLVPNITPEDYSVKDVTWKSNNGLVSVDKNGKVTAINYGEATITATAGDKTASCVVKVIDKKESRIREVLMKFYNAMNGPNWKNNSGWGTDKPIDEWDCINYSFAPDPYTDGSSSYHLFDLVFIGNGLKGEIPECIGDIPELTSFRIEQEPGVTGTLPDSFSKLVKLRSLVLDNTSMTSLPDIFSPLTDLGWVEIIFNEQMTGPLPESLGTSDKIRSLVLKSNGFTGTVPASWAKHYKVLSLISNNLSGEIPGVFLEGGDLAEKLRGTGLLYQMGSGFDISGIEIPGYWPIGSLKDIITDKTFSFDDVVANNRYTVYLSWAPWCPFSKSLMPILLDYYKKYHKDGLEVIATVITPEDYSSGFIWQDLDTQIKTINEKGYGLWYNFYFYEYRELIRNFPSSVPNAEIYDRDGNVVYSSFVDIPDPVDKRFGKTASMDLIPFLEELFGPLEDETVYSSTDYSKDGEVITLQKATVGKGINIVFMGDAYIDRHMGKGGYYEDLMRQSMEQFFAIEPYKTFRNRFNVYAVKVVSKNEKTGEGYSTALGMEASYGSISSGDVDKCYEYALKVPGIKDKKNLLIGVLVNSRSSRGITTMSESLQSGVAVYASDGGDSELFGITLRHEAGGHGFAFLDDEYSFYQGQATQQHIDHRNTMYKKYGWFSNVDFTSDPSKVHWSAFLSDGRYKDEVGIFEGGSLYTKGTYRPSENSMMRDNYEYFNAPSRWAIYKRIMELSGETASFEKFLEYDAVNRGQKQKDSAPRTRSDIKFEHTPPVVVP